MNDKENMRDTIVMPIIYGNGILRKQKDIQKHTQ